MDSWLHRQSNSDHHGQYSEIGVVFHPEREYRSRKSILTYHWVGTYRKGDNEHRLQEPWFVQCLHGHRQGEIPGCCITTLSRTTNQVIGSTTVRWATQDISRPQSVRTTHMRLWKSGGRTQTPWAGLPKTNQHQQIQPTMRNYLQYLHSSGQWGTWHHRSVVLVQELGRRATMITGDSDSSRETTSCSGSYLWLCQRGTNMLSFQNTFTAGCNQFFYFFLTSIFMPRLCARGPKNKYLSPQHIWTSGPKDLLLVEQKVFGRKAGGTAAQWLDGNA